MMEQPTFAFQQLGYDNQEANGEQGLVDVQCGASSCQSPRRQAVLAKDEVINFDTCKPLETNAGLSRSRRQRGSGQ